MQCGRPPQQPTGRQVHRAPRRRLGRRIAEQRSLVAYAAALLLRGRSSSADKVTGALASDELGQPTRPYRAPALRELGEGASLDLRLRSA
jgi:hypothetical protein